ncbi:MAG TPA: hypothetical protein VKI44_00545 [Acetobacteraceae bacterium]|nr:hypothetical protein [Acetobacteraceae bacterium]
METLRIPFILWFSGEAPPNLASIMAPVAFDVSFLADSETVQQNAETADECTVITRSGEADV